jgi:tetratricopeptide (TPR) repeat protein
MGLGSLHFLRGDLPRASSCFLDALGLTRKARDTVREAALCDNISLAFRSQLQTSQALRYARRALSIKVRQGLLLETALTRMVLGALLDDSGDHAAATAEVLRARETFRARGDAFRQAWATCGIASAHLALEQYPEAVEWFDRTLDEAPKDSRNGLALAAHAGKIQVFLATGDLARAHEGLRAGAAHLHPGVGFEARLAWIRAQTLAAFHAGRGAAARIRLREAIRLLSRSEARHSSLQFRLIGLLLDVHLDGPSTELDGRIDALIATLEPTGLRPLLCESILLGAEAAVQHGDVRRARFLLTRADPLLRLQPQPSYRIRRELLRSRLAASHAERIAAAMEAFRQATRHELRPLVRAAALQLGRTYEAREDFSSALKYYQEAGNDAGHRSA